MHNRDSKIKQLRPQIDFGAIPQPLEQFQEVLRQLLKFQNDILVQVCNHSLEKKQHGFSMKNDTFKSEFFYQSLKKDIPFKEKLIGMVSGLFTSDETEFYLANQQEVNKRLVEFIYERVLAQLA